MKLNKIFSLLKQRKSVIIAVGETAQWIGDGQAMYPVYDLPELKENNLQALLDLSDKEWDKYTCERHDHLNFSEDDFVTGQVSLSELSVNVNYKGKQLIPLIGAGRIYFVSVKYLKPFGDVPLTFSFRAKGSRGEGVIAVIEGMLLRGVIAPEEVIDTVFTETVYKIYALAKRQQEEREEINEAADELENLRFEDNDITIMKEDTEND